MKLAVSGKGGVGKTTLSAMLTGALIQRGHTVIAIDADPDSNLASALGVPSNETITPISQMKDLIHERTGSTADYGGFFKLNPKVDDIPEAYARRIGAIRLLVLGGVTRGGAGCMCPASALLKALLVHLALGRDEAVVMDMEAGIEHLGRATAQAMDALLVVVDGGPWSVQTARRVRDLAGDIGVRKVLAVANRVDQQTDFERIEAGLDGIPLIGRIPADSRLAGAVLRHLPDDRVELSQALRDHMQAVEHILEEVGKQL